ncbi:thiolase C-terminal domain-containing protein [Frankia nepalensis]|uniref:Acetyl-CoA acetyltransferase n=1 Tax=Frankia nepalensis TaxID=1836974 RepID=A0A937US62_9ACTN|nr:acetyl-CoA acetyltransferase [Frankia nepalensis]MBL7632117.1 acetyl-CoA acetyltransferase [Frankia nepalensis]
MTVPVELRGAVAVVGAAETDRIGVVPDMSAIQLHANAARNALRDAGLDKGQIDGVASAGMSPVAVADYLGIEPSYVDGTSIGGGSFMLHVAHAVAALTVGYCNYVLITHGESGRSRLGGEGWAGLPPTSAEGQFEVPYGALGAASTFTVPIVGHMAKYGTTEEQIASVAVATRAWAARNSRAMKRAPITVEDVLTSRLVAWPIHLLECCLVTDGGGALILTTAERARDLSRPPVYILGTGEGVENVGISTMRDLTDARASRRSGERAFRLAGLGPADVDHLMLYDAFAHTPMFALEALGFVKPGESGPFFAEGRSAPGGDLPVNTNGGGLSYTHTGRLGMFAMQESVRQLRGEAEAQVPGIRTSLAHGIAHFFSAAGTVIMSNQL